MRQTKEKHRDGIQWTLATRLEDLDFAADLGSMTKAKPMTKAMRVNSGSANKLELDGEAIDELENFSYLGSNINKNGGSDWDIQVRIGKARTAFEIPSPVLTDIQYKREVCPPVWLKDMESNQTNLQQAPVLRQQMPEVNHGHPLARGHGNELWTRAEQKGIYIQMRRRKWVWIGHSLRKPTSNVTRNALRWDPQGKTSHDRPRNSWIRTGDDEAGKACFIWNQIEKLTENRTDSRRFLWTYSPRGVAGNKSSTSWPYLQLVNNKPHTTSHVLAVKNPYFIDANSSRKSEFFLLFRFFFFFFF